MLETFSIFCGKNFSPHFSFHFFNFEPESWVSEREEISSNDVTRSTHYSFINEFIRLITSDWSVCRDIARRVNASLRWYHWLAYTNVEFICWKRFRINTIEPNIIRWVNIWCGMSVSKEDYWNNNTDLQWQQSGRRCFWMFNSLKTVSELSIFSQSLARVLDDSNQA